MVPSRCWDVVRIVNGMARQFVDDTAVDAAAALRVDTVDLARRTAQIMVAIATTYTKAATTYRRLADQRDQHSWRFHQHAARLDQRAAQARRFAQCELDYSNQQLSPNRAHPRANRAPAHRLSATKLSPVIAIQPEVVVNGHDHPDCVVLRLRGRLSLRSNARIRHAIAESLAGAGRVLIDLSGLRNVQTSLLRLFPAALAAAGGWPSARLVLFGAGGPVRAALVSARITETVPLAMDVDSARLLLDRRPPQVRRHTDLPGHASAGAIGRMFVRQACAAWSVPPDVSDMALLVSTELASNAVEHAHTPSHLTLTYTGSVFRVAVRDYCTCPTPIRPRLVNFGTRRCHGLHLVAAVAKTWCVNQHQDGKTIWADLAIDPPT